MILIKFRINTTLNEYARILGTYISNSRMNTLITGYKYIII